MKPKQLFALALTTFLFLSTTFSQNTSWPNEPYIEVKGSAETEITPNEIYIQVVLKEYEESKVLVPMATIEENFVAKMKAIGLAKEHIHLDQFSTCHIRVRKKKHKQLQTKTFDVMITSVDQILPLMEALGEIPEANARLARVSHSELERFRKEVKQEAAKAAKEKATLLSDAVGAKIGKPLKIVETSPNQAFYHQQQDFLSNTYINQKTYAGDKASNSYTLRPITLRYEVLIQFQVE